MPIAVLIGYRLTATNTVVRTATVDGETVLSYIAPDLMNRDWVEYQAWLAEGNVPDPFVPPPPPPTARDANARLDAGILAALDVAVAVRDGMQATPDNFSNAHFTAMKIQLDALTEALVAMLQAQATA